MAASTTSSEGALDQGSITSEGLWAEIEGGGVGAKAGGFFPAWDLSAGAVYVKVFAGKKGSPGAAIWVFECHDERGSAIFCEGWGWVNPVGLLCDFVGGIVGVVCWEGAVALLRGPGTVVVHDSDWDAID